VCFLKYSIKEELIYISRFVSISYHFQASFGEFWQPGKDWKSEYQLVLLVVMFDLKNIFGVYHLGVVATTRHSRTNDLTTSKALSRAIK